MSKEYILACAYCGRVKEEVSFCIGASIGNDRDGYDWTMWEGTGKVSCASPVCFRKGSMESSQVINNLIVRR